MIARRIAFSQLPMILENILYKVLQRLTSRKLLNDFSPPILGIKVKKVEFTSLGKLVKI